MKYGKGPGDDKDKDKDKKKKKRVYKNEADRKRQARLEGSDSEFQKTLAKVERAGGGTFMWEGKPIAAADKSTPKLDKVKSKSPSKTESKSPNITPKKVAVKGKSEKVLAKDITGKPKYMQRNESTARKVARRLKKRQKRRGY